MRFQRGGEKVKKKKHWKSIMRRYVMFFFFFFTSRRVIQCFYGFKRTTENFTSLFRLLNYYYYTRLVLGSTFLDFSSPSIIEVVKSA